MTDSEKLDLLLEKVNSVENEMGKIKLHVMKSTAELKAMDEIIFNEIERVHNILDRHKSDKTVHTA